METYNAVGWFEIPVTDMDRAKKFYETMLGVSLSPLQADGYDMQAFDMKPEAKGASGALIKGDWYNPTHDGVLIYFTAPDIDDAIERAQKNGGKVLMPKKDIGEYGYIAIVMDTEGNRVGLHTNK